jgi:predicted Zn-dependent protease
MYPYLSPHGLIMKINRDETPYDASTAAKDQDFWDWYTRRLLKDPMYRRDFAGQKSFSKLRAAIAGLYANQGRHAEAAQAFREACMLYPASPEAAFRYAQECLLPFKKWDIALELMDYTDLIDPRNKRTATLRDFVKRIRELAAQVEVLEMKLRRNGKLSTQETFALAHAYYGMGRTMEAAQLVRPLIDETSEPLVLKVMSTMFIDARLDSDAERCLEKYLRASPNKDAPAWLELAKLQHRTGRRQAAQRSFMAGYRLEPQMVFEKLQRDQELYEIAIPLLKRRQ